ncbi:MAG: tetratricopeptide repeat protein [Deltaproteobacteria bacterium]|nr:tetratricopeptide repeat protein [Deltaproteobacteria bacterium]
MSAERRISKKPALKAILKQDGKAGFFSVLILLIIAAALYYFFYPRENTTDITAAPKAISQIENLEFKTDPEVLPASQESGSSVASVQNENLESAQEAYKTGNYQQAAELLREALRENPDSAAIKTALARSLNRVALTYYNEGNYPKAKELLKEAIDNAGEPLMLENLANVHLKLDELEEAAAALEPVRSDPKMQKVLKGIYTQLGGRNYRNGNIREAIDYYEKGIAIDPSDVFLNRALKSIRAEYAVEGRMSSNSASHFLVKFDGGENAAAGHLIGMLLEEAYIKVGSDLNFYPDDRIEALLYSRETFRDITRSPAWAGAIFDGRIKIPAGGIYEKTAELEKVIFHEYTHAVVHRLSGGRAPTWLNEGIAQYEEGKSAYEYREDLRELGKSGKVSLRMLEGSFMGFNRNTASAAYIISLSSTEYIIKEFGVFSVRKILENLKSGMTLDSAISSAIYLSYDEFEKSWLEHISR